jgi:hypothetical protein
MIRECGPASSKSAVSISPERITASFPFCLLHCAWRAADQVFAALILQNFQDFLLLSHRDKHIDQARSGIYKSQGPVARRIKNLLLLIR